MFKTDYIVSKLTIVYWTFVHTCDCTHSCCVFVVFLCIAFFAFGKIALLSAWYYFSISYLRKRQMHKDFFFPFITQVIVLIHSKRLSHTQCFELSKCIFLSSILIMPAHTYKNGYYIITHKIPNTLTLKLFK